MASFALSYSPLNRVFLALLGLGPRSSGIDVEGDTVRVRMGWAFRAEIPRSAIRSARVESGLPFLGWGVHGWRGRWLVNGSSRGLVRIDLDPAQRARVTGVPVRLRELWISVERPDELVAVLTADAP
jgi:hypothetical protein